MSDKEYDTKQAEVEELHMQIISARQSLDAYKSTQDKLVKLVDTYRKVIEESLFDGDYCPGCECHPDQHNKCECIYEIDEVLAQIKQEKEQ